MKRLRNITALFILLLFAFSSVAIAATPKTIEAYVIRVIDGDTLQANVQGKTERVRMTGVDTPETHHPNKPVQPFGPEAERYTREALHGKTVYLELDVGERDRYGRILAYVWTSQPKNDSETEIRKKMFNARLLLNGYARLMTIQPNVKYVDYFRQYQKESRDNKKGVWG